MVGAKVRTSSNFNFVKWQGYGQGYTDKLVLDSPEFGWPLNFQGDSHPSGIKHHLVLSDYVTKELSMQSVIGPFSRNPFEVPCVISPLMCVPKRQSSEFRVVHDLSFPESKSVNDGIPKDSYLSVDYKLHLPGIDCLVSFILKKGRGCKLFKRDLHRAYQQIPADPKDIPLLGFQVDGQLFFS